MGLDFILVRIQTLFSFESESGSYQASPDPGPGPDLIHFDAEFGIEFYPACLGPGPRPDLPVPSK